MNGVQEEEVVDIDLKDPDVAKAANLIQGRFRGKLGRKGFGVKKKVMRCNILYWSLVIVE